MPTRKLPLLPLPQVAQAELSSAQLREQEQAGPLAEAQQAARAAEKKAAAGDRQRAKLAEALAEAQQQLEAKGREVERLAQQVRWRSGVGYVCWCCGQGRGTLAQQVAAVACCVLVLS
jgi:hypothetical protein